MVLSQAEELVCARRDFSVASKALRLCCWIVNRIRVQCLTPGSECQAGNVDLIL